MEDKKKIGLIVTGISALLCGCPGVCILIFGLLTVTDSDLITTYGNYQLIGGGVICLSLLFLAVPVGAGIYTFLQSRKSSDVEIEDVGDIPPAI